MKKVLILGASKDQLPVICKAKEMNFFVIVCTYNPKEPGIAFADEYHNISTVDKDAVLKLAREREVDMVLSYASDASGPTAAFVAEKLELPGNPYHVVKMMSDKYLFRSFLNENGFFVPKFSSFTETEIKANPIVDISLPFIVKPVDSSGGRGVKRVNRMEDFMSAALNALSFSACKQLIIEEVIETGYPQIHGNGFVAGGKLVYTYLGDHHYSSSDSTIPVATTWPSSLSEEHIHKIEREVNKLVEKSGYLSGPVNIEARITRDNNISIIELAPRSAGNFVSELTILGTGVDMIFNYMRLLDGSPVNFRNSKSNMVAYYLLHSENTGTFCRLVVDPSIQKYISDIKIYIRKGDQVKKFHHMNNSIGIILFKFDQFDQMLKVIKSMPEHVKIIVE